MRIALLSGLLLAMLSIGFAPAPFPKLKREGPNLLVNGSFEEGPAVGNWLPLGVGSTSVKGWVITRGGVDLVGNHWQAAHGGRSIDLHGSPGYGGVSQTFATTPGRSYVVRFALACNPDTSVPKKLVGVSAAGRSATFTFDGTGKTQRDMGWQIKMWRFTAFNKQTTLELYTQTPGDASCGPVIDNVSVCAIR